MANQVSVFSQYWGNCIGWGSNNMPWVSPWYLIPEPPCCLWGGGGGVGFCVTKRTHYKLQALLPEFQLSVRLGIHLPVELPSLPRTSRPQSGNQKINNYATINARPQVATACRFRWIKLCLEERKKERKKERTFIFSTQRTKFDKVQILSIQYTI
jgi:hypothetical protein